MAWFICSAFMSYGRVSSSRVQTAACRDAIDVAALAAGTLALQRQVKGMTAAHAAELKALQEQHATELADVKSRAVTRIKELTAEVSWTSVLGSAARWPQQL